MGILWFFIGAVIAVPLTLMLAAVVRDYKRRGKVAIFSYQPNTRNVSLRWQAASGPHPVLKAGGAPAMPLLSPDIRETYLDRPAFFLDTQTGEPFRIFPTAEMDEPWPNAKHRLQAWKDVREEKVANAIKGDGMDYAKVGAIIGGIAVLLLVIILGLLWRTFGV